MSVNARLCLVLPFLALLLASRPLAAQSTLVVDGEIESSAGGLVFPDGTVQTTAAGRYGNVLLVSKSTGAGLYSTINEAIDAIGTSLPAASDTNRYLVRVGPGTYGERVQMPAFVDLEGSGIQTTRIVSGESTSLAQGTVSCGTDAEVRHLTAIHTGASPFAVGLYCQSGRVSYARGESSGAPAGANPRGIVLDNAPARHVSGIAEGDATNLDGQGIMVIAGAPLDHAEGTASGSENSYGIFLTGSFSGVVTAVEGTASGASSFNSGIYFEDGATLVDARGTATGGEFAIGFTSLGGTLLRGVGSGLGGSVSSEGYRQVLGGSNILFSKLVGAPAITRLAPASIAFSRLEGGVVGAGGACYGNYDDAYAAVTCP
jgi:hypothetical protein